MRRRRISPLILTFGAVRVEWSSSRYGLFTREKEPWYPLNRKLDWPHRRSVHCSEQTTLLPMSRMENPDCPTHSLVARSSALSTAALVQQVARLRTSIINAPGPLDRTQALVTELSRDFSQAFKHTLGQQAYVKCSQPSGNCLYSPPPRKTTLLSTNFFPKKIICDFSTKIFFFSFKK